MDVLRSPSIQSVRMIEGSDSTTLIRWYKAAPGAKPFPGSHAFGSSFWDGDWVDYGVGPGLTSADFTYAPGRNRGFDGRCPPAHPDWFRSGMPLSEAGKPSPAVLCCRRTLSTSGGPIAGFGCLFPATIAGELGLNGVFSFTPPARSYFGALVLDGRASRGVSPVPFAAELGLDGNALGTEFQGSLVEDGQWSFPAPSITFAGSLVEDGQWQGPEYAGDLVVKGAWDPPDVAGELVLDGRVEIPTPATSFAGELVLDGASELPYFAGELVEDGQWHGAVYAGELVLAGRFFP